MDNFNLKNYFKKQYLEEGTCGYTPDGKPRSKPASSDLMKEAERAADKFNVNAFGYQTKYYKVCPSAKAFMDKVVAGDYGDMSKKKREVIRLAQLHDVLFFREIKALKDPEYAAKELSTAEYIADEIKSMAQFLDIPVKDVDYVDNHVEIIRNAAKKVDEQVKNPLTENTDQEFAIDDLRNIVDDIEQKSDEAREIVRTYFPNELSRLEGYGAFNLMYSNNRYDVTLGKFVDGLEEGDYDDLDDEDYVNESINLSDYNEDVEKVIDRGIKRINVGSSDEEDVLYYVHNNWMGGNISAEEAMKKISKYLDPR